jgi:hypothetical protein
MLVVIDAAGLPDELGILTVESSYSCVECVRLYLLVKGTSGNRSKVACKVAKILLPAVDDGVAISYFPIQRSLGESLCSRSRASSDAEKEYPTCVFNFTVPV